MKPYVRILGCTAMLFIFAAFLTSCATHQKLGCPMRGMGMVPTHNADQIKHC
ncbi:MAG: hypothetical protein JO154_11780 [Chitinophaga sp.]|uniref:hypothetical protein n=1 Tax=Chitinophaga sp. TaxID=1869181 RepID=UPI0025C08E9E|nr:hypothetical protein [Chitinophaga sp.]MBV8253278.1 hypothetical protein [Chitinophaga sp.]